MGLKGEGRCEIRIVLRLWLEEKLEEWGSQADEEGLLNGVSTLISCLFWQKCPFHIVIVRKVGREMKRKHLLLVKCGWWTWNYID